MSSNNFKEQVQELLIEQSQRFKCGAKIKTSELVGASLWKELPTEDRKLFGSILSALCKSNKVPLHRLGNNSANHAVYQRT